MGRRWRREGEEEGKKRRGEGDEEGRRFWTLLSSGMSAGPSPAALTSRAALG